MDVRIEENQTEVKGGRTVMTKEEFNQKYGDDMMTSIAVSPLIAKGINMFKEITEDELQTGLAAIRKDQEDAEANGHIPLISVSFMEAINHEAMDIASMQRSDMASIIRKYLK